MRVYVLQRIGWSEYALTDMKPVSVYESLNDVKLEVKRLENTRETSYFITSVELIPKKEK